MSRALIGGAVAAAILVLTAVAYFVSTSTLEDRIRRDVRLQVERAEQVLLQNASLEGLSIQKRVEAFATNPGLLRALRADERKVARTADDAFRGFLGRLEEGQPSPDIIALVDAGGDLIAQLDVPNPLRESLKDKAGKLKYRAIELALSKGERRYVISDIWNYEKQGLMKVGVAPVVDPDTAEVAGALILAYSMTARDARDKHRLLGTNVAYFHGEQVFATSFQKGDGEDTEMQAELAPVLARQELGKAALVKGNAGEVLAVSVAGENYLATAGRWPRFWSHPLPPDYPPYAAGALVLLSLDDALAPLSTVKTAILLTGLGAFVLALLAMALAVKRILSQADEIEVGLAEITNGNLDYTFEPVGADLDGMAHALNVMLARLLGRPEPDEEQYDDEGNLIEASPVDFDNNALDEKDAEAMALAREPELDYYDRLYNEYLEARKQVGESIDGVTQDNFIAKLHVNESKLKLKYKCRAVRFRVVVKDDKVSLKPVPIH